MRSSLLCGIAAFAFAAATPGFAAPLVCLNDQTVTYATNAMVFLEKPEPGSATIIEMDAFPPAAKNLPGVPVSVMGPPTAVARIPGTSLALVANSMHSEKVDGQWKHVPDRTLSLLRLNSKKGPAVIGKLELGLQPTAVSVAPDGKTAYVTNRAEGTLSVIEIKGTDILESKRVKICEPTDSLAHIEVSPDGKHAVATLNEAGTVLFLGLVGDGAPRVLQRIAHGKKPYAARFFPDGKAFAVADIGTDSVTIYQTAGDKAAPTVDLPVGRVPEGLEVSPDGQWIAASCMEGANLQDRQHPKFGQPAKIFLFRRGERGFELAKTLEVEGGPQFAVFSPDGQYLVVSNTRLKQLAFYKTDGGKFTDTGFRLPVEGEPVAFAR